MGKENKSYRIRTNVGHDSVVNFSIDNTVESLEILSLKINQENTYRLMGSNTGIVAGRVLANGGFGVPNVKVSVFIEYEDTDNIEQRILYTYASTTDRNYNGVRYNLLPDKVDDECHQNIGTFPSKRVLLDNNNWIDIFDKYYKYTTRTNEAGDYMIYGVPTGNQTIHMDVDMSDIGVLSQKPRDMIHNGYNGNMFESPTKFKVDTNIDALAQVRTQDQAVYVYPFWGDTTDSNLNASITRCDMNINYKFEPTCIFMGSVITDTGENAMTKKCVGAKKQGKMADMITGEGKIEMIRKTPNGQIEQFSVNGDNNINGDGVWCYQIPMNLDYVMHDEFGKMVMTDNPNIGIPTRARVRFRLSMAESPSDAIARKRARYLIPNNPRLVEDDYPDYCETKEIDYEFGTKTRNENFRDLFWNNVYTVKSYIPRLQKSRLPNTLRHLGIKTVNHPDGHNPMPFNNLRIKFNFVYMFLCALVKVLVTFVGAINSVLTFISWIMYQIGKFFFDLAKAFNIKVPVAGYIFNGICKIFAKYNGHGVKDSDGISAKDYLSKVWKDIQNGTSVCGGIATWFMRIFLGIGCGIELNGLCETDNGEVINVSPGTNDKVRDLLKERGIMTCNDRIDILYNCIENQLAQDNEVTQFNFYNDWINGVVYLPLWYRKIKKRRNGTIKKDVWCSTDNTTTNLRAYKKNLRLYNTNIPKRTVSSGSVKTMGNINPLVNNEDTVTAYANNETGAETLKFSQKNDENCYGYQCHKFSRTYFKVYKGLVYEKLTMLGDRVYYYKPCDYDPSTGNSDLVTLFATDLVLLGSLNDCDIHGIPQFFKTLESTTYNMPPDLMSEFYDYTNENSQNGNDEQDAEEIDLGSKITEYTGADWGNLGADQSNYNEATLTILGSTYYVDANENQYDNGGLFYGLTCFDSYTKPKSCINLSRICELGISLDETDELPTTEGNGTDNDTDVLTPDGFISYDEIYNPDYRSMFATLNSNFLKTTLNSETGLLEYDFNYLYIDNFDGSLKQLMKAKTVNGYTEKSDFEEKANYINNHNLEQSSDAYLSFRYGNYVKRNGNKIYYYENNNNVGHAGFANILGPTINGKNRQPRYENSFYFYFGLNEGKTAIDKFNTEFFSDCTNKFASEVPYDLTYQGNSWCPINSRDGFIAFNMNVEPPYTVTFTNKDTNDIYFQDNINSEKFIFCDLHYMPDGYSKYARYSLDQKLADGIDNSTNEVPIIPNGSYTIEVTDGYDNTYNDNLTFELPRIGFVCDVNPFNCKNAELMERFKDESELLAKTYADIADHARFVKVVNDNMVIDMDALTYSLYKTGYIIKKDEIYYTKNSTGFHPSVASDNMTVTISDEFYYYHEPRLDRDVRGFVALSEMTEDDFRIDFQPIDTDFFGSNYIGTSVSVHVTYDPYTGDTTIPFGETYFLLTNGKYEPMVAQDDIKVPSDNRNTKLYAKPIVDVTENHAENQYQKFNAGYIIHEGDTYYERRGSSEPYNYVCKVADHDITVGINNEFYYKIDICGYLGYIIYDGVITHYFGVPYGGQKYKITVTQLCECDHDLNPDTDPVWCDTENVTVINIIVYEDEFKLFINGIDYDIIQKFKTGWNDAKLISGEFKDEDNDYSTFSGDYIRYNTSEVIYAGETYYTYENNTYVANVAQSNIIVTAGDEYYYKNPNGLYGWDDILNIGSYDNGGPNPKKLSQIEYMRYGNPHTDLTEVMKVCEVLNSNYDGNATGADTGETPYDWNGIYCYNAPSDDQNYYYKGSVTKRVYSYAITNDLYNSDGNKVIPLTSDGVYYKDASRTHRATKNTTNADYYVNDVYTYTIKPGTRLYDSNGNRIKADQIQYGGTYYLNPPNTTIATLGVDYFEHASYEYEIADGVTIYTFGGNEVTASDIQHGTTYYVDNSHTTQAVLGVDYFESANYQYTISSGVTIYDESGNVLNANQIQHIPTYYKNVQRTVSAVLGTDYNETGTYTYKISSGVTIYDNNGDVVNVSDIQHGITYYINELHTIPAVVGVDYIETATYSYTIDSGVTIYDGSSNIIQANQIQHIPTYYLNVPGENEARLNIDYFETCTYAYQIINDLYDSNGDLINVIVHGNTYYIDETHTVEAETGVDYTEVAVDTDVDVTRYDYKIEYLNYADNEYVYDGNTYRYEYVFNNPHTYKEGVVNGYPNGLRVNMFRRTLRIKEEDSSTHRPYELYKKVGDDYIPVSSIELTSDVDYYRKQNLAYIRVYSIQDDPDNGVYTLTSPILSYKLETPLYRAEFKDIQNGEVLVNEDNYGVLTYKVEDNIEYYDLECLSFYDYRDIINKINSTIVERNEIVRKIAGAFRINDGETMLTLTTKTKAKPVKYLIAGSSEISVLDKIYSYKPTKTAVVQIATFANMSDINDTKYAADSSIKNVSDGYVVDKNLETPTLTFSLPTLTYDYVFVPYNNSDLIYNGNTYYSEEIIACKQGDVIKPYAEYYLYNTSTPGSEYYEYIKNGSSEITVSTDDVGKYFYITGEKIKRVASIPSSPIVLVPGLPPVYFSRKTIAEFIPFAHTTDKLYKIATSSSGSKQYLPYHINKNKHPYYVSVMNDNDSIIPPGKDLTNFTNLGTDKDLTKTFGVHFYNKPLKSDFKMILSFINNIPAYPQQSLGGDSYVGTVYGLNDYSYYIYEYSNYLKYKAGDVIKQDDIYYEKIGTEYVIGTSIASFPYTVQSGDPYYYANNNEFVYEDTLVYATIDNTEPDIKLRNKYYCHTVKYKPQTKGEYTVDDFYVSFKPGDTIKEGETYYTVLPVIGEPNIYTKRTATEDISVFTLNRYFHRKETVREIKENILIENGLVDLVVGRRCSKYTPDSVIYAGDWYYTILSINNIDVIAKVNVTSDYTVTSTDNCYSIDISRMTLYSYDFVNGTYSNSYYVYNGDIVYYTYDYEQYPGSSIIYPGESYLLKHDYGYTLETNDTLSAIIVEQFNREYYKVSPQKYYRHVVDLSDSHITGTNVNKMSLLQYVSSGAITVEEPRIGNLGEVYYPDAAIPEYLRTPIKCILVDRKCQEYNGSVYVETYDSNSKYAYSLLTNCLDDEEKQNWAVRKTDDSEHDIHRIIYNNYNHRYYNFADYAYTINLTKRQMYTSAKPIYLKGSSGEYTRFEGGSGTPIDDDWYDNSDYFGTFNYNLELSYPGPFYGDVVSSRKITANWQPVNVFMPGFVSGYFYNGIPRSGDNYLNRSIYDNTNIKAELNETNIALYTPDNSKDVYNNINVRRLIYTPNDHYTDASGDYPATYGKWQIEKNSSDTNSLSYQYAEVPLIDDEIVYTDGYGDNYRRMMIGTLSLQFDMPIFTYFNLGRAWHYASDNLDYEDYIRTKTFYTSDDGYVQHQTLYYLYDLENTEYPLLYYDTGIEGSTYNSNLRYDKELDRFYFVEMPEILKNIENSGYISKSKSTDFNLCEYLRKKYNQGEDTIDSEGKWAPHDVSIDITRPRDKFFAVANVDGYYTISPVIETQRFLTVLNYTGFDNRAGSYVYITACESRNRNSEQEMRTGVHYIEDMYYMLYYRFVLHLAAFDYTTDNNGNANGKYNSDVYTQICSVSEGTAEHCYIKVYDQGDKKNNDGTYETLTYWASAIKLSLSSLGADGMDDNGKIYGWLQVVIEDISGGLRVSSIQSEVDKQPLTITEFDSYEDMMDDYNNQ